MLSLKRNHITALLQVLFVLCTLVSCIDDDLVDGRECSSDEEMQYLGIKLKFDTDSSPFTRAGDEETPEGNNLFEEGTNEEHKVAMTAKNFVILFKKDEAGVDKLLGIYDFWDTDQNTTIEEDEKNKYPPNAEAKYTYVARIPVQDIENWKGACLVVLNGKSKVYDKLKEDFGAKENVATLDEVLTAEVWKENDVTEDPRDIGYADKNHKYFTMTNSAYYCKAEGNGGGDEEYKLHVAEEFDAKEHVKKTYAAAKREPITVYVERMLAKFSFKLPDKSENKRFFYPSETQESSETLDPKKTSKLIVFDGFDSDGFPKHKARRWRIEVTGWNANAFETQSYIFKKLPEYNKLNTYLKDFEWWNNPENLRSYWCEDPHYDYDEEKKPWSYSWQYRKTVDYDLEDYEKQKESKNNLLLRNYSFDDLGLGKPDRKPDGSEFKDADELRNYMDKAFEDKIVYTPENTYDAEAVLKTDEYAGLDSRDELLAGTHLLIGAEFQMDTQDYDPEDIDEYFINNAISDPEWKVPKHLFRDHFGYYYLSERECIASLVHDFNQLLESLDKMRFVHYLDWDTNDGNSNTEELLAETEGKCSLYYRDKNDGSWQTLTEDKILNEEIFSDDDLTMSIAELRGGDGKRLPWIDKLMKENRLAIGHNAEDPTLSIYYPKEGEYEASVADPAREVRYTKYDSNFIKSLLYEWLGAIDHFNQGRMYYPLGIVNNPQAIKEGKTLHYGVVRNNWYRFTLENVIAFGIAVDRTSQPIIPERVDNEDKVNSSVEILDWHHFETTITTIK